MLRIWGRTTSSNVTKLLWLMDELGLDYERVDAGGAFGRTGTHYRMQLVDEKNDLAVFPFNLFQNAL